MRKGYANVKSIDVSKCKIVTVSDCWTTKRLMQKAKNKMNEKVEEGWRIISVSIGYDIWFRPTAFITIAM